MSLPDSITIARLEESRLARVLAEVAPHSAPCAGGILVRARPGSWMNKAVGLGMNGPVAPEAVEALIEFFAAAGIEPRIEVSPYADPTLLDALATHGFVVRRFATTMVYDLTAGPPAGDDLRTPPGIEIVTVDPADEALARTVATTGAAGFLAPGQTPAPEDLHVWIQTIRTPRATCLLTLAEGEPAGAGVVEVSGPYATLFAQSVLPAFRRRGIQRASIARRLAIAASQGAHFATLSSEPAGPTERNAWRAGFHAAFSRAIMARPGPGLVPVGGR